MMNKITFQKLDIMYDVCYGGIYYQYTLSQTGNVGSNKLLDLAGEPVEEKLANEIIDWIGTNRKRVPKVKHFELRS